MHQQPYLFKYRFYFLELVVVLTGFLSLAIPAAHAATPTVTEFSAGITADAGPNFITAGPDDNLWFTESSADKIGKITPSGVVTEYSAGITPGSGLSAITTGPDGNIWFSAAGTNKIGKITPSGVVTEYSAGITANAGIYAMTAGHDGNVWFVEYGYGYAGRKIGKITPSGVVTEYDLTVGARPYDITTGPDGNVWFVEYDGNRVGKITPSGVVTEYSAGITPGGSLYSIATGPDGNLWFTEPGTNKIGKITPSGVVTEYPIGMTSYYIILGHDGNLWFTEDGGDKIGKMTTSGAVTIYSAGITPNAGIYSKITAGPDGNIWFAEYNTDKIGRLNLIPTVTNPDDSTTTTVNAGDSFPALDLIVKANATLVLDGSLCDVTVNSGGTLMGTGHACTITVNSGGTIAPGHSPGCITSGNLNLSGTYTAQLGGITACSGYDQLQVTGTVTVGGTLNPTLINSFLPKIGDVFTLITNDGTDPVTGTFISLSEGATLTAGTALYRISYTGGDGNDIILTALNTPTAPSTGLRVLHNQPLVILAATALCALVLRYITRRTKFAE